MSPLAAHPAWKLALHIDPTLLDMIEPSRLRDDKALLYEPEAAIIPGILCPAAVRHYAHGQCAIMALTLQSLLPGSRLVILHPQGQPDDWVHALVRLQGTLIDVRGIIEEQALIVHWNAIWEQAAPFATTALTDASEAAQWLGDLERAAVMERSIARVFAQVIIEKLQIK